MPSKRWRCRACWVFNSPTTRRQKGKTTAKVPVPFAVVLTFAQIKPAKINLSLFGRLRVLVLPHMVDGAGTFAHVKAGSESAR